MVRIAVDALKDGILMAGVMLVDEMMLRCRRRRRRSFGGVEDGGGEDGGASLLACFCSSFAKGVVSGGSGSGRGSGVKHNASATIGMQVRDESRSSVYGR